MPTELPPFNPTQTPFKPRPPAAMGRRQPNLHRAHSAISRVVERAAKGAAAAAGPDQQAGPGSDRPGLQTKRKRSRKEDRKQARKEKKQRKGGQAAQLQRGRQQPAHVQQQQNDAADAAGGDGPSRAGKRSKKQKTVLEESLDRAEAEAEAAAEAERIRDLMESGENAAFFRSLRSQRLISGGTAGEEEEPDEVRSTVPRPPTQFAFCTRLVPNHFKVYY